MQTPRSEGPAQAGRALGVLLGASNLTLALPAAVREGLRRLDASPRTLVVAHGPGRSYGIDAGVVGFRFAGLSACRLAEQIDEIRAEDDGCTGWALLTDVGNDILYGCSVEEILGWVDGIAASLLERGLAVGITALPLESIRALRPLKFAVLRRALFPFRPMSKDEVLRRAGEIQSGLEEIARSRAARLLPVRREWYGADPIHLLRGRRDEALRLWLDGIAPAGGSPQEGEADDARGRSAAPSRGLRRRTLRPVAWRWAGLRFAGGPKRLALDARTEIIAL